MTGFGCGDAGVEVGIAEGVGWGDEEEEAGGAALANGARSPTPSTPVTEHAPPLHK